MRALIIVDLQNDFVAPGALPVPGGIEVVGFANQVISNYDLVIATQDWHPKDHLSFASQNPGVSVGQVFDLDGLPQVAWPDHCVQGTAGAEFLPGLNIQKIDHIVQKGTDRRIDSYSGFYDNGHRQSTGLEAYLRKRGVTEVDVMGLATDYCVRFTALDSQKAGFTTSLLLDGCRGVDLNPGDIKAAIEEMQSAGVRIK